MEAAGRSTRVSEVDRHVLDVVPVGLQVWEAVGDALTLRYANGEAQDQALPSDDGWQQTLLAASAAQEAATFELEAPGDVWWRAQITPLGAGAVLAAYWNITAQKLHERSLKASERLNREILSGLQEGVVVVDTQARVVVANEAAAELFGVPLQELMDRSLSGVPVDLLDDRGHLLPTERLPLERALRGEEVTGLVVRFVRRDGSLLWVEVHANPLHNDDGTLYGAGASYDDVTARERAPRSVRTTTNSSPPSRATRSRSRTQRRSRRATSRSASSPAACP